MPITLNKRKDFKKSDVQKDSKLKAQDETIQITKKEWESMQESLTQLQSFMNDLIDGNLEIEIIDDEKEEKPEKPEEEVQGSEEIEPEVEAKEDKAEPKEKVEEEKGEDADIEEVMKDPAKRKAVLEYLKATDSVTPIKDLPLSDIRRKVTNLVRKVGLPKPIKGNDSVSHDAVVDKIVNKVRQARKIGRTVDAEGLTKLTNYVIETSQRVPMKTGDGKAVKTVKPVAKDSKPVKRKTIRKSIDKAIPDFTSRFEEKQTKVKAVDNKKEDLSKNFSDRFN